MYIYGVDESMHAHINTMDLACICIANLLWISLLVIGVYGAHDHQAPAHPPQPQHNRPAPPPPPQRPLPPRKKVVVQGIVECFYCVIEKGPGSVSKSALLPGAVVKLQCNNTKQGWEEDTTTDKSGSFTFRPEKVSTWGAHKCKVTLVSSPRPDCPIIDNYYFIDSRRAFLTPTPTNTTSPFQLFTVGPLWFEPGSYMCL